MSEDDNTPTNETTQSTDESVPVVKRSKRTPRPARHPDEALGRMHYSKTTHKSNWPDLTEKQQGVWIRAALARKH